MFVIREVALQRCVPSAEQSKTLAGGLCNNQSFESIDLQYSRFQDLGSAIVTPALAINPTIQFKTNLRQQRSESTSETLLVNNSILRSQIETEEKEWEPATEYEFEPKWLDPIFVSLQSNTTMMSFLSLGRLRHLKDDTADEFRAVLESQSTGLSELWLHSRNRAEHAWKRVMLALAVYHSLKKLRLLAPVEHKGVVATATTVSAKTTLHILEAYICFRFVCDAFYK